MIINFVGNYQSGYVGESADESHLADSLISLGHTVRKIPRDVWREWVLGNYKEKPKEIPEEMRSDINIIAKWHHFFDGQFISELRKQSESPVLYWVWDYMYDQGIPEWHVSMAKEADLYLSGEAGIFPEYIKFGVKPYYFQFDVCDGRIPTHRTLEQDKKYNVAFFGSYLGQGDRIAWMKEINKVHPIKIFSWNFEEWRKEGFDASPAVYGEEFNKTVADCRVILGFNVNTNCWGYWSNRVGKVTVAGGFLLQQYVPGMEQFLTSNVDYFSTPDEAIEKIKYYLDVKGSYERTDRVLNSERFSYKFTSQYKVAQLAVLMERFLKGNNKLWNQVP